MTLQTAFAFVGIFFGALAVGGLYTWLWREFKAAPIIDDPWVAPLAEGSVAKRQRQVVEAARNAFAPFEDPFSAPGALPMILGARGPASFDFATLAELNASDPRGMPDRMAAFQAARRRGLTRDAAARAALHETQDLAQAAQ